jgi:hypothetical protein
MGLHQVVLPPPSPIPGQILFAGRRQSLWKVRGDGRVVDLLEVYVAAADVVGDMPQIGGEFGRLLNKLADTMAGRRPAELKD